MGLGQKKRKEKRKRKRKVLNSQLLSHKIKEKRTERMAMMKHQSQIMEKSQRKNQKTHLSHQNQSNLISKRLWR